MEIEAAPVGKTGKIRYFIARRNSTIAWFDSLEAAAYVLRFLSGANMGTEERDRAIAEMRNFDHRRMTHENHNEAP